MSTELRLEFLPKRMDSRKAGNAKAMINLMMPDNCETSVIEVAKATNIKGFPSKAANLTITLARRDLESIISGATTFEALLTVGKAQCDSDRSAIRCAACSSNSRRPLN